MGLFIGQIWVEESFQVRRTIRRLAGYRGYTTSDLHVSSFGLCFPFRTSVALLLVWRIMLRDTVACKCRNNLLVGEKYHAMTLLPWFLPVASDPAMGSIRLVFIHFLSGRITEILGYL